MGFIWCLLHFLCQSSDLRTPDLVSSSHGLVLVMRMGHRGILGQRRKQDGKSGELAWGGGGAGQGHCTRDVQSGVGGGGACAPSPPLCRRVKGVTWATSACSLSSPFAGSPLPRVPAGPHTEQVKLISSRCSWSSCPQLPTRAHIREHRRGNTHHSTPTGAHCRNPKRKGTWSSWWSGMVWPRAAYRVTLAAALCPP